MSLTRYEMIPDPSRPAAPKQAVAGSNPVSRSTN